MSTTRSADTIYNVQMLRFLAAVMVLFGHVQHEIVTRPHLMGEHFREFSPLFWPGGVDIFFTISGFIMYHLARESFGRPGASVSFLLRRIVRVCPPYWFFTTLMIGSILMLPQHVQHGEVHLTHVLGSYLFFPVENYYGRNYPILILGWTLNFEMLFYVIFGVALLFRKAVGIALIIGVLGFLALSSIADIRFGGPFNFWGDSIVLEFLGGILIAHLRSVGVRLSPLASLTIFLAGLGLMVLIHSLNLTGQYWVWRFLWMGVPAFLICLGPSLMRETGRGLGPVGRFLVAGGDASYALYLSHPFTIGVCAIIGSHFGLLGWSYFLLAFTMSLVAAFAVYRLIEVPLTTFSRALLLKRSKSASARAS